MSELGPPAGHPRGLHRWRAAIVAVVVSVLIAVGVVCAPAIIRTKRLSGALAPTRTSVDETSTVTSVDEASIGPGDRRGHRGRGRCGRR